jgi:hypothetical protein
MAKGKRTRVVASVVAAMLIGCVPLAADVAEDEPIGLRVHQTVATRGLRVDLQARPLCRLAAEDGDSRSRAAAFMTALGMAVASALAEVDIRPDFSGWQAEWKVVDHPAPATDEAGGVRIVQSSPGVDAALMRSLLRAKLPALPNFRARCTFEIAVRNTVQE